MLRRALFLVLGWGLIALGVAGLFLPVLQGVLFILLGLLLLSRHSRWAARLLKKLEKRFPGAAAKLRAAGGKLGLKRKDMLL